MNAYSPWRVVVLGPVRDLPPLPPVPLLVRPFRGLPLLTRQLPPGWSSVDGGIDEFPLSKSATSAS